MNTCVNCGTAKDLQIDHIIPLARGGEDTPANLQTLCGRCNRYKSAWTNEEMASGELRQWRMDHYVIRGREEVLIRQGEPVAWPVGFDWETKSWSDSAPVEWITGALFTYPTRHPVNA